MTARRSIAGYDVTFSISDPRLAAGLDTWLDTFSATAAPRRPIRFEIGVGTPRPLDGAGRPVVEYYYVNGYRDPASPGRVTFLGADGSRTDVDTAAGRAATVVPEAAADGPPWTLRDSVSAALTSFLRAEGVFPLHAAAVTAGECGILIAGPPMAGKTTLSLALVRHGCRWVSDDKVLLSIAGDHVEGAGLFTVSNIDPGLSAFFPQLTGLASIAPAHAHSPKRVASVPRLFDTEVAPSCRPLRLLFPRLVDIGPTRVTPLPEADAFAELLRQSPVVAEAASGSRHMDVLSRLVRQARSFRLDTGRDFLERPERLGELLRSMDIPA